METRSARARAVLQGQSGGSGSSSASMPPSAHLLGAGRRAQQALRRREAPLAAAAAAAAAAVAAVRGDHMSPGRRGRSGARRHVGHAHGVAAGRARFAWRVPRLRPRDRAAAGGWRRCQQVCGHLLKLQPAPAARFCSCMAPHGRHSPKVCLSAAAVFLRFVQPQSSLQQRCRPFPVRRAVGRHPSLSSQQLRAPPRPSQHAASPLVATSSAAAMTAAAGGAPAPAADARLRALYSVMQSIEVRRPGAGCSTLPCTSIRFRRGVGKGLPGIADCPLPPAAASFVTVRSSPRPNCHPPAAGAVADALAQLCLPAAEQAGRWRGGGGAVRLHQAQRHGQGAAPPADAQGVQGWAA